MLEPGRNLRRRSRFQAAVRLTIRIVLPLAAVAVALILLAGASSKPAKRGEWGRLADQIARPWLRLQRSNGSFPDFTDGEVPRGTGRDTRYGDSELALAL